MGAITERRRMGGGKSFLAQIKIVREGKIVHRENRTFDRRQAAAAWLEAREKELAAPGGLDRARAASPTLGSLIDRYLSESEAQIGRTKAQVLRAIKSMDLASRPAADITSADVVEALKGIAAKPQTRGNYLSHLSAVFALAKPAWGVDVDRQVVRDAHAAAKRLGVIGRAGQRQRRPTLDELDLLMQHFQAAAARRRDVIPMTKIVPFAIFSTRRQDEITRLRWEDLDVEGARVLVRDMKNPGVKIGNHIWCDLPEPALRIVQSMPRVAKEIFPYSSGAVQASFHRACLFLGFNASDMADEQKLTFHDLRHEGASWLFELGWSIPRVASVTGHRSWSSLQRYTHIRRVGDKYAGWKWLEVAAPP